MKCFKCEEVMMQADFISSPYGTRPYLSVKKKGLFESAKLCTVTCRVCPKCGYIEFQANDPSRLLSE